MSDEELNVAEDVGGGAETPEAPGAPKKTGFLPGIVITILKWVAVGVGFIILGATTTLITFNIINGRNKSQEAPVGRREAYSSGLPILAYAELGDIRGNSSDDTPAVWSCNVKVGYGEANKEIGDEILQRKNQLRNAITIKLSRKKFEELRPDRLEQVQEELKTVVNGVLSTGKCQEVLLDTWTVMR